MYTWQSSSYETFTFHFHWDWKSENLLIYSLQHYDYPLPQEISLIESVSVSRITHTSSLHVVVTYNVACMKQDSESTRFIQKQEAAICIF